MNRYRCVHCERILKRDSEKQWVQSFCVVTGRNVHLQRLPEDLEPRGHVSGEDLKKAGIKR